MFQHTTVSKLALILKTKEDGSVKKRIVIDLRRSLGNSKAVLPERLILPRPHDCVEMVRDQYAVSSKGQGEDPSELWGCEFILIDVTDAFMSFGVERKEWGHCLAPGTKPDEMLLFTALLFGFKTAPLLYSRLAALLSRWLQSIVPPGIAAHQTYLDDALWFLQGPLKVRNRCLGLILFTMEAIGLRIAHSKGHRAGSVQWIGVTFSIVNRDSLVLGLPKPFLQETLQTLVDWGQRGYIAIRDLRSMAGRLSWVAGVLPRSRWTVTVVYAVMKAAETEKMESEKGDRRAPKNMVAVRRFELARKWLVAFLQEAPSKADENLQPQRIFEALSLDHHRRVTWSVGRIPGDQREADFGILFKGHRGRQRAPELWERLLLLARDRRVVGTFGGPTSLERQVSARGAGAEVQCWLDNSIGPIETPFCSVPRTQFLGCWNRHCSRRIAGGKATRCSRPRRGKRHGRLVVTSGEVVITSSASIEGCEDSVDWAKISGLLCASFSAEFSYTLGEKIVERLGLGYT